MIAYAAAASRPAGVFVALPSGNLKQECGRRRTGPAQRQQMPNNGLNGSAREEIAWFRPSGAAGPDLEDLDAFLMSDRAPSCMPLSDLDGFLTAVAIGPELIVPSEWLPGSGARASPSRKPRRGARRIGEIIVATTNSCA